MNHFRALWQTNRGRLGLLITLALLLRLLNLSGKSLWVDEAFVFWQANQSPETIWLTRLDNHPPLYYLLLHLWLQVGQSEFFLRLPSVVASLLNLPLLYLLARRLLNERVALLAVALLALAPLDIWYAQEARMVIFVTPPMLVLALGLLEIGQRWRGALWLAGGLALGLYFDYTIIPLWLLLSGIWLGAQWRQGMLGEGRPFLRWLLGSLLGWLAFAPLWLHLSDVLSRAASIFVFVNLQERLSLPQLSGLLIPATALALLLAAAGGAAIWPWLWQQELARRFLPPLILLGFALVTVATPIPRAYSLKRLLVTGWPLVTLSVAWLLATYGQRRWTVALLTLSLSISLITLAVPKDDWRGVVAHLNEQARPNDIVWLDPAAGQLPYDYYQPRLAGQFGRGSLPEVAEQAAQSPTPSTIWHIAERQPSKPIPATPAEAWLDNNWQLLKAVPFYRLELRHYGPR